MKPQTYHNTNGLSGMELKAAVTRAQKQEEAVLLIYKETRKAWSPSQIHEMIEKAWGADPRKRMHIPLITSVRRAITNLTGSKDLIHLKEKRKGPQGAPEGLWFINPEKHPTDTGFRQASMFIS